VPHLWVTVGMRGLPVRRGASSGRGAAADNPHVTTVNAEVLTPAGRRWIERTQGPLDLPAAIFLIDVILIWSFPDGPPAFVSTLNVIAWIVWACFAVDYIARLQLSIGGSVVRHPTQRAFHGDHRRRIRGR
jgi:hypothetical protein